MRQSNNENPNQCKNGEVPQSNLKENQQEQVLSSERVKQSSLNFQKRSKV
jgi:hypothetical protein